MSIKLMSAIWDTEIGDLQNSKTVKHDDGTDETVNYTTKGSTSKSVLLAIADHANDYGQGSFPGLRKLEKKTEYSRPAIIDAIATLRAHGVLSIAEKPSMLGTNDYTINIRAFPKMAEEAAQLPDVVKPLYQQEISGKATLPADVKPLYHNHTLTKEIYTDPIIEKMNSIGMFPNGETGKLIDTWKAMHSDEKIMLALDKAKGKNQKYADTILRGWEKDGYPPTKEDRVNAFTPKKAYTSSRMPPMRD